MTHLTSSPPSRRPRCLHLFDGTAFPDRAVRISHVHCLALMTCRALRPRGRPTPLPISRCRMLSSGELKPSTIPLSNLDGALSLQPEGLRPITSLSTLDPHGYPYRPKTRYQARWVSASWAALAAASKTAPRGAQALDYKRVWHCIRESGAGSSNLLTPTNNINHLARVSGSEIQLSTPCKSTVSPSQVHHLNHSPKVYRAFAIRQLPQKLESRRWRACMCSPA